jgi:hypothetical protein
MKARRVWAIAWRGSIMRRVIAAIILAYFIGYVGGCSIERHLAHACGAPVPKNAELKRLTPELLTAAWVYEYSTQLDGVIQFHADGTYSAMHDLNGTVAYCGTWSIEDGNSVIIDETMFNTATGSTVKGGRYRFTFVVSGYPTLIGKSSGGTHVKLHSPSR